MFKGLFKSKNKKTDSTSYGSDCIGNIINDYDSLYGEAVEFVLTAHKASSSALQKKIWHRLSKSLQNN